jgi:hypothetical protein
MHLTLFCLLKVWGGWAFPGRQFHIQLTSYDSYSHTVNPIYSLSLAFFVAYFTVWPYIRLYNVDSGMIGE